MPAVKKFTIKKQQMRFYNWFINNTAAKAIALSLTIFLLTFTVSAFTLIKMYQMTTRLYKPIEESNHIREKFFIEDTARKNIGYPKLKFLKMQYTVLSYLKEHHKELGRVYYTNYYSFNVVLTIATVITAILIFLIA